jgi:hypothetical protein
MVSIFQKLKELHEEFQGFIKLGLEHTNVSEITQLTFATNKLIYS